MSIKTIIKFFLIWQIAILVIISISAKLLPLRPIYLGGQVKYYLLNPLLYARGNFDGIHYTSIAERGHGYAQHAFFPLYPNLIRFVNPIFKNTFTSGNVISFLGFFGGLIIFVKLLRLDYSSSVVFWTVCALLVFPTSFYFTFVYTEGLFFFLLVSAFYSARKNNWWLAGIIAALASYTRFIGIFIFPALIAELWLQNASQKWSLRTKLINLAFVCISPLGLLYYMMFLKQTTGDYLAFYHSLPVFGVYRSEKIILLYQVFWRYTRMALTVTRNDPLYLTIMLEFATGIIFLFTSIYAFLKGRLSYAIFNLFAYIAPSLTGSFVSLPRYVLMCFSSFIVIGQILSSRPRTRPVYLIVSAVIMVVCLMMFARGYWVS